MPEATRQLILRLLGERMGLRAIARVAGVSRSWLQGFVNALYRDDSRWRVEPPPDAGRKKAPTW